MSEKPWIYALHISGEYNKCMNVSYLNRTTVVTSKDGIQVGDISLMMPRVMHLQ